MDFTYYSLFAGIGGMTMGLEPLGGKCLGAWEYDPSSKAQHAQNAHKLLHPHIPIHSDVTKINPHELDDFDLLAFTAPCQSFSSAGKRGGFEDTRGTLTFDALNIAKVKKPKVLFMENVKGLINYDKGNALSTIIHAINEIGYLVDFTVINSKYYDVPQNRERIYLVAMREDLVKQEDWKDIKGTKMLPKAKRKYLEEGAKTFNFDFPTNNVVKFKLREILEDNVDEKYYLSDDKVEALIPSLKIKVTATQEGIEYNRKDGLGKVKEIAGCLSASDWRELNRNQTQTAVAEIHNGIQEDDEVRAFLTPDRVNTRQEGRRIKENDEVAFTLTAMDRHGVAIGQYPKYRIRKLTPRECFRLQAVPPKYIDLLLENFSNTSCYKFAGNGLTTTVISAIGEKLLTYLEQ